MSTAIQNAQGVTVYESRWGFHPCSREDFLMFKSLHKQALHEFQLSLRHRRWSRKTVHRLGPEPPRSPVQSRMSLTDKGFRKFYLRLLEVYVQLRHPVVDPDQVQAIPPMEVWQRQLVW